MPRDWLPSRAQADILLTLRTGPIKTTGEPSGVSWISIDILARRGLVHDEREAFAPRVITITDAGRRVLDRWLALNPEE